MRRWLLFLFVVVLALPASAARRVVSLAPSMTEIMVELQAEDLLVGVLDGGERSTALRDLPSVGRYGQLDLETLLSVQPDLILLWPGAVSPAQREQLRESGIALYEAEPHDLEQLAGQLGEIGRQVGRESEGRVLEQRFRDGLSRLRRTYLRDELLPVFYQVWNQPLYTIGGGQIISDALRVCGARNVFEELKIPAPQVGVESVLAREPAVIVGGSEAELAQWRAFPQLQAKLVVVPDKGIERPSFQMLGAVEKLCQSL
ncbi:helical backbone metal receptor [Pseudomonas sp. LRF_L74]|uniref:helical backbone metal receptor n=1 Tax=Pseudomonas sp. LRF_L74 TaxID=3369422 RepID=UPI003F5E6103